MRRILHVLDHSLPLQSGYVYRTQAILQHQRALGWQTFQLTSAKHYLDCPEKETIEGFEFFRTPPYRGPGGNLPVLRELGIIRGLRRRLAEVVRETRPDIIHVHSPVLNAVPALSLRSRLGTPVVYEVRASWEDAAVSHGTTREGSLRYRLSRSLESWAVRRADQITTICEGLRSDLAARGVPAEKISVVPNAVDCDAFTGPEAPDADLMASLGLQDKMVLGFIGSFYGYEGLQVAIRALPELLNVVPELRLLLVGGGPDEAALKALAESLDLDGKVVFTGRVSHDQVHRYYDLMQVMIYPRLANRLTELVTPLKPLEAMAQHRLVIASDVGGHRELIADGQTGYLFEAGSSSALARTVLRAYERRDAWPDTIRAARRFVEQERNWKKSVAVYQEVYDRLARA